MVEVAGCRAARLDAIAGCANSADWIVFVPLPNSYLFGGFIVFAAHRSVVIVLRCLFIVLCCSCLSCCRRLVIDGAECRAARFDTAIAGCARAADCIIFVALPSGCLFGGSIVSAVPRSVGFSLMPGIGMSCNSRNHLFT